MTRALFRWSAAAIVGLTAFGIVMLAGAQDLTQTIAPSVAAKPSVSRVVVRTLVDGAGAVKAVQIRESSGNSRLDEEALQVVSKVWSFSPLKINGKGVEVWINVPINFVQAETPLAPAVPVAPETAPAAVSPAHPASESAAGAVQAEPAVSSAAQPAASAPASAPAAVPASAPETAVTPAEAPASAAPFPPATPAASAAN